MARSRQSSIPCSPSVATSAVEVLPGPQLGVQRVVAAALVADRVRAARVARLGHERVVAPLAVRVPDRVDGREVQDVEAELGQPRDLLGGAAQPAPGAREHLVPGAEAPALAVDLERQRRVELLLLASVRARGLHERRHLGVEGRAHVAALLERVGDRGQPPRGGAAGALGRLARGARRPRRPRRPGRPGRPRACGSPRRARRRRGPSTRGRCTASAPAARRARSAPPSGRPGGGRRPASAARSTSGEPRAPSSRPRPAAPRGRRGRRRPRRRRRRPPSA